MRVPIDLLRVRSQQALLGRTRELNLSTLAQAKSSESVHIQNDLHACRAATIAKSLANLVEDGFRCGE